MTETGEIPTRIILAVLRKNQVTISGENGEYTLAKGDRVETYKLGDSVSRHMAQKLARTFKVPVHEFYGSVVSATPTPISASKKPA